MTNTSVPISVNTRGDETHPSWVTLRANTINAAPGVRLHGSDIAHRRFVRVTLATATRDRQLGRDWIRSDQDIVEVDMSMAQWGGFVSSFGDGSGVPVTLSSLRVSDDLLAVNGTNIDPPTVDESRVAVSIAETKAAAQRMVDEISAAFYELEAAFDAKAGRKELGDKIRDLHHKIGNTPANVQHAAATLAEHVETVVTKARADIENMVDQRAATLGLEPGDTADMLGLNPGG